MFSSYKHVAGMFDATVTFDAGHGFTAIARPWAWQRPDATGTFEWYQLQVRYQSRSRLPYRVDAGIITSPLGLATLQNRADLNPTMSPVFYYVIPLPRFDATFDGLNMMSAGYPFGAIVTTSGTRWDLRGGMIDSTPARPREELQSGERPAAPQIVLGGGYTPRAGIRVGAGVAHGRYRKAAGAIPDANATVFNLEAEYAFNQTRLSGGGSATGSTRRQPSIAHVLHPGRADDHPLPVRRRSRARRSTAAIFPTSDLPHDRGAHTEFASRGSGWRVAGHYGNHRYSRPSGITRRGARVGEAVALKALH